MESVDTGTLVQSQKPTEHNNYQGIARAIPVRSVAAPASPEWGSGSDRTLTPKPWQPLALGVPHPQAAPPFALHALRLGHGEQRVRHESVIAEHRVVEAPHPDSVEPRTKTVADVLRHAALIIEERGWEPSDYVGANGEVCIEQAVCEAAGIPDDGNPYWHDPIVRAGLVALERATGSELQSPPDVTWWNDTPGRTATEVIAALRAAADEADR